MSEPKDIIMVHGPYTAHVCAESLHHQDTANDLRRLVGDMERTMEEIATERDSLRQRLAEVEKERDEALALAAERYEEADEVHAMAGDAVQTSRPTIAGLRSHLVECIGIAKSYRHRVYMQCEIDEIGADKIDRLAALAREAGIE